MFSETTAQRFPESRIWDHAIELKPEAPSSLPGKIYLLTVAEQEELQKFIKCHDPASRASNCTFSFLTCLVTLTTLPRTSISLLGLLSCTDILSRFVTIASLQSSDTDYLGPISIHYQISSRRAFAYINPVLPVQLGLKPDFVES